MSRPEPTDLRRPDTPPEPDASEPADTPDSPDDDLPLPDKSRLVVARDIAVFQVKLFVDGLRDVLLSPTSLVLGLIGLLISKRPGEPFYRLLRAGRATDSWIDLFGDAYPERDETEGNQRRKGSLRDLEHQLRAIERNLATEDFDQGARESVARVRTALQGLRRKRQEEHGDTDNAADRPR